MLNPVINNRAKKTLITFFVSWAISGNFEFGLMIGGIDALFKTIAYFFFERMWIKKI